MPPVRAAKNLGPIFCGYVKNLKQKHCHWCSVVVGTREIPKVAVQTKCYKMSSVISLPLFDRFWWFLAYFAGLDWSSKICNRKTGLHGTKWWFVVRFNARSISPQIRRSDGFRSAKEHLDHLKFVYALLFLFTTHSFHFRVQYCADRSFGTLDISKERPGNDDRFSKNAEINRVSVKCP